jgi:predicted transcriptional regulator
VWFIITEHSLQAWASAVWRNIQLNYITSSKVLNVFLPHDPRIRKQQMEIIHYIITGKYKSLLADFKKMEVLLFSFKEKFVANSRA